MVPARAPASDVVASAAGIVVALGQRYRDLIGIVQERLTQEIPDLAQDAKLLELTHDTVESNIETWLSVIHHDIAIERVEPPAAALEHARRLAQRQIPAEMLVRAYRLGHEEALAFVLEQVARSVLEPQLKLDISSHITRISFGYIDRTSRQVLETYQREFDQWAGARQTGRMETVRGVLSGAVGNAAATSAVLGHPLEATHLAMVVWFDADQGGDEPAALHQCVRRLAAGIGCSEPLFVTVDRLTGWAWVTVSEPATALDSIRAAAETLPDGPRIAVGTALTGMEGFRSSHHQAIQARTVALASGAGLRRFVAAGEPGLTLAALLSNDLQTAAQWVAATLGPLAGRTDSDERLRETLRVFLATGSSSKAAAQQLHLHTNTVKYRVGRALQRRGRPLDADRLDVEVALLLCHWFGAAVLQQT